MTGYITGLKENTIVINTEKESFKLSHLKVVIFLIVFCGISSLFGYVLLGVFGNSLMLPVAFLAPILVLYIYTLSEDIVNPFLRKLVVPIAVNIEAEPVVEVESTSSQQEAN
jgi:hypothetical protein